MRALTAEQLDQIVRRLVEGMHPERIYLFGSHAGGTAGADSDIDILVVVPDTDEPMRSLHASAESCLRGTRLPVELVVLTHGQFERQRHWVSSLSYVVAKKGKLLYAA